MIDKPLEAECLDSEGHIHDLGRMAHTAGQIYKTSLAEHVQRASVRKCIPDDILPSVLLFYRHLFQGGDIDLAVKMSCVAEDRLILHHSKMLRSDDVLAACDRDKDVTDLRRLIHLHDAEPVHGRVQRFEGVYLGDDHVCAHSLCAHGRSFSAPSVSCDDNSLARNDEVGRVHDRRPDRLTGTVFVVIIMLCLRVIDRHHRAGKNALPLTGFQTVNACRRLFTAADQLISVFPAASAEQVNKITAVVDDQMRVARERLRKEILILGRRHAIDSEGLNAHLRDRRRNVILRGERIAAGQIDFRPAFCKHKPEVRGLGFQMDGYCYAKTFERLLRFELLLNFSEGRHKGADPFDFLPARGGEGSVFNSAHDLFSSHSGSVCMYHKYFFAI